jgi:pyruvate kinase
MVEAGMNVVRFNMAHSDYEEGNKTMALVKKVRDDLKVPLAIMVDIKGPEIRTGKVDSPIHINKDDVVILTGEQITAHDNVVPVNYPDIVKDVEVGGHVLLNDGIFDLLKQEE